MSEQQRIFVTVALCLAIMIAWPFVFGDRDKPAPSESTTAEPAETAPGAPTDAPAVADTPTPEAGTPTAPTPAAGAPTPEAAPAAPTPEAAPAVVAIPETSRPFETALFRGELSNSEASLTQFELVGYNERVAEKDKEENGGKGVARPVSLVTARYDEVVRQARINWDLGAFDVPQLAWAESEDEGFTLRGSTAQGVETQVKVTPREGAYALDYVLSLRNNSSKGFPVKTRMIIGIDPGVKAESSWFTPPMNQVNGLCAMEGETERQLDSEVVEDGPWSAPSAVKWAGIDRQYFVVAAVPANNLDFSGCRMSAEGTRLDVEVILSDATVGPNASWERSFTLFLGPKKNDALQAVAPDLQEVIDYSIMGIPLGFLARPMVFLLSVFHGWTASWGLAIMLLTLVVKVILFPVTFKSSVSMRKMQLLKPELDKLKKQFADDRERQQMEQMKLFKEKGVNPLGGCLPMLLQMPVWFALYRTLWSAVDLYQQSFLWLPDLTAKEPMPFMAFALGGLTFLQQKLMPTSADSQQAKMMMYFMPVMLTVFMIALPSGLVLYILFNSVLTILQQLVINKRTTSLSQ